jgi:hypothetical protein
LPLLPRLPHTPSPLCLPPHTKFEFMVASFASFAPHTQSIVFTSSCTTRVHGCLFCLVCPTHPVHCVYLLMHNSSLWLPLLPRLPHIPSPFVSTSPYKARVYGCLFCLFRLTHLVHSFRPPHHTKLEFMVVSFASLPRVCAPTSYINPVAGQSL